MHNYNYRIARCMHRLILLLMSVEYFNIEFIHSDNVITLVYLISDLFVMAVYIMLNAILINL